MSLKSVDSLDSLLRKALKLAAKNRKQIELEKEAAERQAKLRKLEEFASAFDAERFRFLVSYLPDYSYLEINQARKLIDTMIQQQEIRAFNDKRKRERAANGAKP